MDVKNVGAKILNKSEIVKENIDEVIDYGMILIKVSIFTTIVIPGNESDMCKNKTSFK